MNIRKPRWLAAGAAVLAATIVVMTGCSQPAATQTATTPATTIAATTTPTSSTNAPRLAALSTVEKLPVVVR